MDREQAVDRGVAVLKHEDVEERLSDGYGYYCGGDDEVDETLRDIAETIVDSIQEVQP